MAGFEEPYIPRLNLNAGGGGDDLSSAFRNFNQSLQQLAVSRTYDNASDALKEIQQSEASDTVKRQQQSEIASQLGSRMLALGAPASHAALMQQNFAPQQQQEQYTTPAQILAYAPESVAQRYIARQQLLKPPKESDSVGDAMKQEKFDEVKDDHKFKVLEHLRKATNEAETSSRNTMGQLAQRANSLTDLNALIGNKDSWSKATSFHLQELATGLDRVFKGGVATETGTHGLMPNDIQMKLAQMKQYATSEPTPANQAAFVALYNDVIQRTGGIVEAQLHGYKKNTLAAIPSIAKKYSDDFPQLSQRMLGENGRYDPDKGKVVFDSDERESSIGQKINDLAGAKLSPEQTAIAVQGIESDPDYWPAVMTNKTWGGKMRMIKGKLKGAE